MTLEKAQLNRRIFRAATLVAIAFSPLCMAASSYAAINKETTMARLDTLYPHAVPQADPGVVPIAALRGERRKL